MSRFIPVLCDHGQFTLKDTLCGQDMHSRIGPTDEARRLYVEPTRIESRIQRGSPHSPVVIYDMGMGMAVNSVLLLEEFLKISHPRRRLEIVSFESATEGLSEALVLADSYFPFLNAHKGLLKKLLSTKLVQGSHFSWNLITEPFSPEISTFNLPAPDVIYYDFYSPQSVPNLWTRGCFEVFQTRRWSAAGEKQTSPLILTYSSSTRVRLALLQAGFWVGEHASTQRKRHTTAASDSPNTLEELGAPLLASSFLRKVELGFLPEVLEELKRHPQFSNPLT